MIKIFNYTLHRKKQLDIMPNKKPIVCIHRIRNSYSKRVFIVYGE